MIERDYQADMHVHTTTSDGTWTVEELSQLIIKSNIKLFSITDHDTIDNSIMMLHNIPNDICYVIGAEISSTYNGDEYHITAYDFDYENSKLNELRELLPLIEVGASWSIFPTEQVYPSS